LQSKDIHIKKTSKAKRPCVKICESSPLNQAVKNSFIGMAFIGRKVGGCKSKQKVCKKSRRNNKANTR
jgi:hypothetical protein